MNSPNSHALANQSRRTSGATLTVLILLMGEGGRGQRDFLGSETLAKRDLFRSMKDVEIFLGREKTRFFWVVYF